MPVLQSRTPGCQRRAATAAISVPGRWPSGAGEGDLAPGTDQPLGAAPARELVGLVVVP